MTRVNKIIILLIVMFSYNKTITSSWGIYKQNNINYNYDTLNFYINFLDLYREYDLKLPVGWVDNFWGPTNIIYLGDLVKSFHKIKKIKLQSSELIHELEINKKVNVYKTKMLVKNINNINLDTFKTNTIYIYNIDNKLETIEHFDKNQVKIFSLKYFYKNQKIEKVILENYFNDEKFLFTHKYSKNLMNILVEKYNNFIKKNHDNNREGDFLRKYYFLNDKLRKITQVKKYIFSNKEELFSNVKYYDNKVFQYYHNELEEFDDKFFLFDDLHIYEYSQNKLINAFGIEIEYFKSSDFLKDKLIEFIELYDKEINFKRNKLFILEENHLPVKIVFYSDLIYKKSNFINSYNLEYEFYE